MKINDISELYELISRGTQEMPSRKQSMVLRKAGLKTLNVSGFTKVAFDTRRIDQEVEVNPRRGLQNYNRSEAFLSEAMGQKLISFAKLRSVLTDLQNEFGREHEWQDSNARVLLSTLDKGLRTLQKDGDYTESQPGTGNLAYIEELLHVRYRLTFDDLKKMGATELKRVILSRDEELIRRDVNHALEITKRDVAKQGYDTLMEKLFDGCRASAENPDIERTITITIRDRFNKEG